MRSFLDFARKEDYLRSNENSPVEKMQAYRVQRNQYLRDLYNKNTAT